MTLVDRVRAAFSRVTRRAQFSDVRHFSPTWFQDYRDSRAGCAGREEALRIPVVVRGRDKIVTAISTLPLQTLDERENVIPTALLRQIDPNVPNVVTMAQTVEDLLFDGVAWWRKTALDFGDYPISAQRLDPASVSVNPPADGEWRHLLPSGVDPRGYVWIEGKPVPWSGVIRFDSPNEPLLETGADAIALARAYSLAAMVYAKDPRPMDYITSKEPGYDPTDDELKAFFAKHGVARKKRSIFYLPGVFEYNEVQQPTPADLQLVQLKREVNLELANLLGVDPEDVGISTTSRTYQNDVSRRQDSINDTLAGYMAAITDRLSMDDVTVPGHVVRFNLGGYLKADPKTRSEVQLAYLAAGVITIDEIRKEEGRPVLTPAQRAQRPIQATVGAPVTDPLAIEAAAKPRLTLARETGFTFDGASDAEFAVDTGARTITGLAVPYGAVARSGGRRYRFAPGSLKYAAVNRVKLLRDHANGSAVGKAISLVETVKGLVATFRVSMGAAGDEVLALAADEVLDGLSVGVDFRDEDLSPDPQNPGVLLVTSAALREISLTAIPAFDDSRLTSVRASDQGAHMKCDKCGLVHADGVTECATPNPEPAPASFSAEQIAALTAAGFSFNAPTPALPKAAVVNPVASGSIPPGPAKVSEPLPYQFSRVDTGKYRFSPETPHDFSSDLIGMFNNQQTGRDYSAELARLNGFIAASFADVEIADLPGTLVSQRRPDMWVPQRDYATPLWDLTGRGAPPAGGQKFDVPKFTSASGLVSVAVEKTEPAAGSFVDELQTITPGQLWGKVEITRQVWRQGGNPAFSGILWAQMLREFYEDREAAIATFLATLTAAADITLTTQDASPSDDENQATMASFEAAMADLQFARGGNRFEAFAVHQALYRVGARTKDDSGRPMYPMLNPMNANGTTARLYSTVDVGGVTWVPAYALGTPANASTNSWLFDPSVVMAWAGAPERLFWDFGGTVQTANIPQLSFVTVGLYADYAVANTDISGVRQVVFDPNSEA